MRVSPCKNCIEQNRKKCSETCEKLADYREYIFLTVQCSPLSASASPPLRSKNDVHHTMPIPRYIVEGEQ